MIDETSSWFRLVFPTGHEAAGAVSFVRSLSSRGRGGRMFAKAPVVFELRADSSQTTWTVGLPQREAVDLCERLGHALPGLSLQPTDPDVAPAVLAVELGVRSTNRTLRADLQSEITTGLLQAASRLRRGEQLRVQWLVGGWLSRSPLPSRSKHTAPRRLRDLGVRPLSSEEASEAKKKRSEHLFACVGRIAVSGTAIGRARHVVQSVIGAYEPLRVTGAGISRRSRPSGVVARRMDRLTVNEVDPACVLRPDEIVAVLGWPLDVDRDAMLPGVSLQRSRLLRPDPAVLRPAEMSGFRVVADSGYPSQPGAVVLPAKQALRHLHVLGPTGVGKSTLLANMILGDIAAGYGTVVVDPKGDLVTDVLARLPNNRHSDVVVMDATDVAPVGLNPLAGSSTTSVDGLLGVFYSLWASSWGPRLHDILHAGLLTLSCEPGHSLVELPILLTNPTFRRPLVAKAVAKDPFGVGSFWAWYENLTANQTAQALGPVLNKLRAFILRPHLRAVLGQPDPRFEMAQVFRERKTLLVRLPAGEIGGEAAALLGSLVVHEVWKHTTARSRIPADRRRPVFVYLDEFQEVVRLPLALGDVLAQARGLGVGMVLAHQHLSQLTPDVKAAVLANAGSRVAFRLDHDDATVIAKRTGGRLEAGDFASLPAFGAYGQFMADDEPKPYCSIRTRPLPPPSQNPKELFGANRERYGTPRSETEDRLKTLLGLDTTHTSGGSDRVGGFGVIPPGGDES